MKLRCDILKINDLQKLNKNSKYDGIWRQTPAYASILGNFANCPVPSEYTLALIKTNFSTCRGAKICNKHNIINLPYPRREFEVHSDKEEQVYHESERTKH